MSVKKITPEFRGTRKGRLRGLDRRKGLTDRRKRNFVAKEERKSINIDGKEHETGSRNYEDLGYY